VFLRALERLEREGIDFLSLIAIGLTKEKESGGERRKIKQNKKTQKIAE
jgi:hypothetical protein